MKITESQLRAIIKKELTLIKENESQPQQKITDEQLADKIQAAFKAVVSLDSSIKSNRDYSMEYPDLVRKFITFYNEHNPSVLGLEKIQNQDIIPLAAVTAWMTLYGRRS